MPFQTPKITTSKQNPNSTAQSPLKAVRIHHSGASIYSELTTPTSTPCTEASSHSNAEDEEPHDVGDEDNDGGDSDKEGNYFKSCFVQCKQTEEEEIAYLQEKQLDDNELNDTGVEVAYEDPRNEVITIDDNNTIEVIYRDFKTENVVMNIFPNKPENFKIKNPRPGTTCPEEFKDVDNPGNWNDYIYTAYYKEGKGKFYHFKRFGNKNFTKKDNPN